MGSMPFVIDYNAIERTVSLSSRCRYWLPSFAHKRTRKSITDNGNVEYGGRGWRIKATGKNSSGIDGDRDRNDAVQVRSETSMKKFVTQKNVKVFDLLLSSCNWCI